MFSLKKAALIGFATIIATAGNWGFLVANAGAVERSLVGDWSCVTEYEATTDSEAFGELSLLSFGNDGYFSGSSLFAKGSEQFGITYAGKYSYDDPNFTLTRKITDTDPKLVDDSGQIIEIQEETFLLEFTDTEVGPSFATGGEGFTMKCDKVDLSDI
jgi:hypothetical protein